MRQSPTKACFARGAGAIILGIAVFNSTCNVHLAADVAAETLEILLNRSLELHCDDSESERQGSDIDHKDEPAVGRTIRTMAIKGAKSVEDAADSSEGPSVSRSIPTKESRGMTWHMMLGW